MVSAWHFPVFRVPDAEDAGNARDATTQLTGTDPLKIDFQKHDTARDVSK